MIWLGVIWKNVKLIGVIALAVAVVWFYKDYQFQKREKEVQTENARQLRKAEVSGLTTQLLSEKEMNDYLKYQNSDLKKKLDNTGIKSSRIESIVSNSYKYRDTSKRETDVSGLVEAIKNSIPKQQRWSDSTKCLINTGLVLFDGQKLKVIVDDRQFKNKSDAVAYWERRQWKFLGIKTRLFGKKEFTSINFDECGESRVMKIEKKK